MLTFFVAFCEVVSELIKNTTKIRCCLKEEGEVIPTWYDIWSGPAGFSRMDFKTCRRRPGLG